MLWGAFAVYDLRIAYIKFCFTGGRCAAKSKDMGTESDTQTVIRASSLPQYTDCARRSAVRLFAREIMGAGFKLAKGKPSIGALVGTATHTVLQDSLQRKMTGAAPAKFDEMQAIATADLQAAVKDGVVWDDTTNRLDVGIKQAARQAFTAYQAVGQYLKPIAIEQEFSANMGDGFVMRGHIDVLEADAIDDWKTGNIQRANMAQYGAYSLLARSNGGPQKMVLREIYIERKGITKPQPEPLVVEYNQSDAEEYALAVAKRMKRDLLEFRASRDPMAFLPNPNSMMCSADYCPAWGTEFCKAHKAKPTKEGEGNDKP